MGVLCDPTPASLASSFTKLHPVLSALQFPVALWVQAHTLYGHRIRDSLFPEGLFPPFLLLSSFKFQTYSFLPQGNLLAWVIPPHES